MQSKATRLKALFGNARRLSQMTGIHESLISRWDSTGDRGGHGVIPPQFNAEILEGADRAGVPRSALADLLEPDICPTCKQAMPPRDHNG